MKNPIRTFLVVALSVIMSGANARTWEGYIMETTDDFDGITTYRTSSEMWPMDSGYVALEARCNETSGMQLALRLQGITFFSAKAVDLRIDRNAVARFSRSETNIHSGYTTIHLNDPSSGSTNQLINQLRAGNTVALRVDGGSTGKMTSKIRLDGFTSVTNDIRQRCGIVAKSYRAVDWVEDNKPTSSACQTTNTTVSTNGTVTRETRPNGEPWYLLQTDEPICVEHVTMGQGHISHEQTEESLFHLFFKDWEASYDPLQEKIGRQVSINGTFLSGQSLKWYRDGEVYFQGKGPVIELESAESLK